MSRVGDSHMGIISWIVLGLVAGLLAKLLVPGRDPGGLIITIVIGVVGAVVGGFIASLIGLGSVTGFNLYSILVAVGGAVLLLVGYRFVKSR